MNSRTMMEMTSNRLSVIEPSSSGCVGSCDVDGWSPMNFPGDVKFDEGSLILDNILDNATQLWSIND